MAKSIGSIFLLMFTLPFVWTDEHERWNTPPELTPESAKILNNDESQTRLFSFIPTATISLNAGNNNAHSVSLGASLDGISLSESNTYNHPTEYGTDGSSISVSKSATVSAGLPGISASSAEAYSNSNNVRTESQSFSFGQATATSFGKIDNGQAITGAASSAGSSQSSIIGSNGRQFSQASAVNVRYPYWSTWSNIGPSNGHNDQRFNRPTLTVSKPCDETRPTLNVGAPCTFRREQKPTIHIYKWQPNYRVSRPGISIEHQLHDSRNSQIHGSTSLQIESKDSKQKSSGSDLISDFAQTVGELFDDIV